MRLGQDEESRVVIRKEDRRLQEIDAVGIPNAHSCVSAARKIPCVPEFGALLQ